MDAIGLIREHEGWRLKAYVDTRGRVTIGAGRNLTDKGISEEEGLMLLQRDYTEALNAALEYPWFKSLNEPRQAVVIDMIFEMGAAGYSKFILMHHALEDGDFAAAVAAMLNSAWAGEVPERAHDNAAIIDTGEWG
jgi:lysozyme